MNNYGSDWTRQRVAHSNLGTEFDLATELGTTLSSAPAPQRLSFARHPSVIGSSLDLKPTKLDKQTLAAGNAFQKIYKDSSPNDLDSAQSPQKIDVQAILDGSTSKPFTLSDFKRFLNLIRRGGASHEAYVWLHSAPLLVDFLLDFKSYVDGFTCLSLREQSKSPHPFEIICDLNAQSPQVSVHPSEIDSNHPSRHEKFLHDEDREMSSELESQGPTEFSKTTPTFDRPNNRKVNWAPSVRSNDHRVDLRSDKTLSAVSSNFSREGSILKPAKFNFEAHSESASINLSNPTVKAPPMEQPMRSLFNVLISKYLASSTSPQNQPNGLLSTCHEISSATLERAILEAKFTTHPAVLSGIALEILMGLNQHVLPAFMSYSIEDQKQRSKSRSQNLCGLLIFLIAFSLSLLMFIVPSPLITPWKLQKPIPKPYRLFLFPLFWLSLGLMIKNHFKSFCLLCWRNKFRSIDCSLKLDYLQLQQLPTAHGQIDATLANKAIEEKNLGVEPPTENKWASHQMLTTLLTSLLLAMIIQMSLVLFPFLS